MYHRKQIAAFTAHRIASIKEIGSSLGIDRIGSLPILLFSRQRSSRFFLSQVSLSFLRSQSHRSRDPSRAASALGAPLPFAFRSPPRYCAALFLPFTRSSVLSGLALGSYTCSNQSAEEPAYSTHHNQSLPSISPHSTATCLPFDFPLFHQSHGRAMMPDASSSHHIQEKSSSLRPHHECSRHHRSRTPGPCHP